MSDGLRERAIRGTAWSALQTWGGRVLSLAVFTTLGRLLEPEVFGLLAIAVLFIELGKKVVEGAFGRSIVQFPEIDDSHLNTALWVSLTLGVAFAGALVLTAPLLGQAFGEPQLTPVLQLTAIALVIGSAVSVPVAIMERELRFGAIAARRLLSSVAGGGTAIGLALSGAGVYALVAQVLVGSAVSFVVVWAAVDWRPSFSASREQFRELFSFGANVVGFELLVFAQNRADDLMIGSFLGAAALGYYFVAYRILHIIVELLATTVTRVALPTFSRLTHDRSRLLRAFMASTRMTMLAMFPTFAGLAIVAEDALVTVFGAQWRPSAPAMQWMAVSGMVAGVGVFYSSILIAVGRPGVAFRVVLARVVTLVGAFSVGVQFGFVGVAAAMAIHALLFLPVSLAVLHSTVGLPVGRYLRQFLEPFLAATLMAGVVWFWQGIAAGSSTELRLATSVAIGVTTYAAALAVLAPGLLREPLEYVRTLRGGPGPGAVTGEPDRTRHPGEPTTSGDADDRPPRGAPSGTPAGPSTPEPEGEPASELAGR